MTKAQYEFWETAQFPVLFAGALIVPAIFAVVATIVRSSVKNTPLSILFFSFSALASLVISILLSAAWTFEVAVPVLDIDHGGDYSDAPATSPDDHSDPSDPSPGDHQAANLAALVLPLFLVAACHCSIFFMAIVLPFFYRKVAVAVDRP
jgi:hypothetical protein